MRNIGKRIKALRKNMNLTPQAISSYLGISTEDLLDMENGNKNITLSILNKLCSLFGCDESYLLCKSDEFDPVIFSFRNDGVKISDLEGIASMNRIYMNMKYIKGTFNTTASTQICNKYGTISKRMENFIYEIR